jgi:ABC-2 type transport system ATP-binding protein
MPSLYAHLTGRENLEVTRRQIGARRVNIDRVLGIVGLLDDARRLVREYSLGMKQRLGLALALLNSPDLLILDEPTNGLDPGGIHEMRDLLRRMPSEHGVTVFLSSHLLGEVEQIADFVGIIREGRIVFQGSLAQLREGQSSRLIVGVQERDQALQFLKARGFDAQSEGPTLIRVAGDALDADAINGLLVASGHQVFYVSLEQASLEGIFLSLTANRTP